ncbi:MAG: FGGY-family carbohydrate kinase [Fimbriimonadales bacterium]
MDLGTSACKVALTTTEGTLIHSVAEPHPLHLTPDGGAEQNPHEWWHTLTCAVRRLLDEVNIPREQVRAIVSTAQWAGTVPVDAQGEPLGNALIWMDTRGAPHIRELIGGFPSFEGYQLSKLWHWLRLTGGAPTRSGKDPLAHLLYLQREDPNRYRAAHKFLEPVAYLNFRLSGRWVCSYETITLHWLTDNRNLQRVDYHPTLLQIAGIPREKLPDLVPPTTVLGHLVPKVAQEWGLSAETQVVVGTPDLHASAIGSGGVLDYVPHLALSTSDWITCHVPFKRTDLLHNMASLPAGIPNRYFIANEQETAGACLEFLRVQILGWDCTPQEAYHRMDTLAERVPPGSDGLLFTPWLVGERTPVENHRLRGGFHHLALHHTQAHLIRAVMEGVALNARWLLGAVERFTRRRLEPIRLIGGGANSSLWCQMIADILGRAVLQMAQPQSATVRGAGMLASVAMGWSDWQTLADTVPVQATFSPNPVNRTLYDELYTEFQRLYRMERRWAKHQRG